MTGRMPNRATYLRSAENSRSGTAIVSRYLFTMVYSDAFGEMKPMLLSNRPASVLTSGLHVTLCIDWGPTQEVKL